MRILSKTTWEILNATADDWENLEQIHHMICFDFSAEGYEARGRGAYYLRPARGAPLLEEVADGICELVEGQLLTGRLESGETVTNLADRSYVWRGWFRMTPEGRNAWDSSEFATLAEQEQPL